MSHPRLFMLAAVVIALAALVAGCSSSPDRAVEGSLAVRFGASRPATQVHRTSATTDDPVTHLRAADITIGAIEARRIDGTWVPLEGAFPTVIDLLALGTVTLPADLLPEGQYAALQVRITRVEPTLVDGTRVTVAPPGTGWVAPIPVDFGVVTGGETTVSLDVRLDRSFNLVDGHFEFEPEIEIAGVEHD